MSLDVVLINPSDKKEVYGALANEFAAIEPPLWLALLAARLREARLKTVERRRFAAGVVAGFVAQAG